MAHSGENSNINNEIQNGCKTLSDRSDNENEESTTSPNSCRPKEIDFKKKRSRTLPTRRKHSTSSLSSTRSKSNVEPSWKRKLNIKFPTRLRRGKNHGIPDARPSADNGSCICISYRRTEDHLLGPGIVFSSDKHSSLSSSTSLQVLDFSKFNPEDYPTEDMDEIRYQQRTAEMEAGIELPNERIQHMNARVDNLVSSLDIQCAVSSRGVDHRADIRYNNISCGEHSSESIYGDFEPRTLAAGSSSHAIVHTQIDYVHCLVPDLEKVTNCGYYWGVMDRYEAENLLDNKPEGTFLLRDSAQDEFLFSVSFRRYGRSLHARVEQWNHKFSFDSHDPAVFASDSVHGLIEHYKDPGSCLFFEPMLIYPLNRTHVFSLQNLCRAVICSNTSYDGITCVTLPKSLKESLRYYHYKQKVRVRKFDIGYKSSDETP